MTSPDCVALYRPGSALVLPARAASQQSAVTASAFGFAKPEGGSLALALYRPAQAPTYGHACTRSCGRIVSR
jgi:hypothetical protein